MKKNLWKVFILALCLCSGCEKEDKGSLPSDTTIELGKKRLFSLTGGWDTVRVETMFDLVQKSEYSVL